MNKSNLRALLTPIVLALAIVFGMMLNRFLPDRAQVSASSEMFLPVTGSKLDLIISMIQNSYVDTVDTRQIVENTIPVLLKDLDPHTVYIPAKDMQRANEGIVGNFGGVGIQFYKYLDTVTVVKVVPGGPSEKAGIKDGDRIVRVNDSLVAGVKMSQDKIQELMRGELGTKVELTIARRGEPKLIKKEVVRGSIPVKSVDVAYMLNDTTGYLKTNTFGMHTYAEFMQALVKLKAEGMRKIIIDLRENEGGVLPIAIQMINEFLDADRLILYTQGQAQPRTDYKSNGKGQFKDLRVDVAYMLNDTTGYLKTNTFGMHTYSEFMQALVKLKAEGMRKIIIDLRENEGGVLPIAIQMINEFLDADRLILYTQGQAQPRTDYKSNGKGQFKDLRVDVLISEFSASASEIFAGAIQDNDRGLIIGRRSFGKGLVQEQRMLPDGSALRLTVARYYTPSGRSIQKPYNEGKEKYYNDLYNRLVHGEFSQKDSIVFDENLKYQTVGGRTVYGGGGIMPDVFVPADTTGVSRYLSDVTRTQFLYEYTFDFMDRHRPEMVNLKDYKQIQNYLKSFDLVNEMANYAARRGLKRDEKGIKESYQVLRTRIEAYIARHTIDDEGFYPILGQIDNTLQEAIKQ